MIPEESLSQHIGIVGKTRSGKTAAAKQLVEQLIEEGRHVCVIDPGGDWWGLRASADGKSAGLPVAVLGGPQADVEIQPTSGAEVADFVANEPVSCVIDVSEWYKADQIRFMTAFVETLYREKRHKPTALHLVLEEADQFAPQKPMGEGTKLLNRISIMVRLGGKRGFRILMISQRPAILHKDVLTQVNTLVTLRLVAKQDKDAIEGWIKDNADPEQLKTIRGSLARLKPGEGWIYAPEVDVLERCQFPMFQTFDAGATPEYGDELVMPEVLAEIDFGALESRFAASNEVEKNDLATPTDASTAALQATLQEVLQENEAQKEINQALARRAESLEAAFESSKAENERLRLALEQAGATISAAVETEAADVDLPPPVPATAPSRRQPAANVEYGGDLSKSERTLLSAFAELYPRALTFEAAAKYAGQSVRSSQFRPNRKALSDGGWVEPAGEDRWRASRSARALIGAPPVGRDPLESWCAKFPPSTSRMLRCIVAAGKAGLSKDAIATQADVSPTSSSLGSGLRELKVNGLITEPDRGRYLADPEVFSG